MPALARSRFILPLTLIVQLAACSGGATGQNLEGDDQHDGITGPSPNVRDTTRLQLTGLGVSITEFEGNSERAGDFDLSLPLFNGPLGFVGRTVSDPQGNIKHLFEYDFFVAPGTLVRAPADGVVAWIQRQGESSDYEMLIRPKMNSIWAISIDHISKAFVDSGAVVKAGDVIGQVRTFSSGGPNPRDIGFFELMIVNEQAGTAHCPLALAHPAKADSLKRAVSALVHAWRARGETTPDTTSMVLPGCLMMSGPAA